MNPLTIVIIVVVVVLVILVIYYMLNDPYTLQGMQNGQTSSRIKYDQLATNGSDSPPVNFTYSIWFYVNDWNYKYGKPKVIFGRMGAKSPGNTGSAGSRDLGSGDKCSGDGDRNPPGPTGGSGSGNGNMADIGGKDPCPAVVLGAIENNVGISVSCYPGQDTQPSNPGEKTIVHTCNVSNVPLQRWVNLLISVYGRTLDVYLNGKLTRTCLLPGIVSTSKYSPIFVTPMGGFDGWTSKLQFWPNSLNPQQAWNVYSKGPKSGLFSSDFEVKVAVFSNGSEQGTYTIGGDGNDSD
jgi:hypothetical protein